METTETMLNGNNLPRELLLTAMQTINLGNAIENNVPTDIKLSKAKISKIIQCWRFSGSLLTKLTGPLIKVAVPLTKKKKELDPIGITVVDSAIDAWLQKKMHGSGATTLITLNEEMNDRMKRK